MIDAVDGAVTVVAVEEDVAGTVVAVDGNVTDRGRGRDDATTPLTTTTITARDSTVRNGQRGGDEGATEPP